MTKNKQAENTEIEKENILEDELETEFETSLKPTQEDLTNEKTFMPSSENVDAGDLDDAAIVEELEPVSDADKIEMLQVELVESNDKLLRALAEAENVRRRSIRDKEDFIKRANANFAKEILTVSDNIRRALDNTDELMLEDNEAVRNFVEGIQIIEKAMASALEKQGVINIDALGKKFDPRFHEAMFEYDDDSQPSGSVGQILEAGYTINGLLLRPTKVGVTKGGPAGSSQNADELQAEASKLNREAYEDEANEPGLKLDKEL